MDLQQENLPLYIVESQNRCEKLGIDREALPEFVYISNDQLKDTLFDYRKLIDAFEFFAKQLFEMVDGLPFLLVATDENCIVLDIQGDAEIKKVMELIGIKPGAKFSEEIVGTNSVDLALMLKKPVQVVGNQHYQPFLYENACYSVPFLIESNGTKKGTVSLVTFSEFQSPFILSMLYSLMNSIEREISLRESIARLNKLNQVILESSKNGMV